MHSKSTCEVIQTYDGYVVQLEGDRTKRLARQRFSSSASAAFTYDWLVRDVVEEGWRSRYESTIDGYRWSPEENIVTFKTLSKAISMAERIESVLKEREGAHAEQVRIQREREAFVEKKVWR